MLKKYNNENLSLKKEQYKAKKIKENGPEKKIQMRKAIRKIKSLTNKKSQKKKKRQNRKKMRKIANLKLKENKNIEKKQDIDQLMENKFHALFINKNKLS